MKARRISRNLGILHFNLYTLPFTSRFGHWAPLFTQAGETPALLPARVLRVGLSDLGFGSVTVMNQHPISQSQ